MWGYFLCIFNFIEFIRKSKKYNVLMFDCCDMIKVRELFEYFVGTIIKMMELTITHGMCYNILNIYVRKNNKMEVEKWQGKINSE